ncbi:MAG: hypothetical protein IPO07_26870 [Haliscomenobacter sp.]|nr:hypothetical protein [Haliscomenobacter sp.]MBK9492020.1 hypothetical protein [Haliscomenobacter sp.]
MPSVVGSNVLEVSMFPPIIFNNGRGNAASAIAQYDGGWQQMPEEMTNTVGL